MGNGTFDTSLTNGFPTQGDFGNAFMKLSTSGGTPAVADYFTMLNTQSESGSDADLGSGGAMILPPVNHDSQGRLRNLAVGAGKDSNIYVVDRDNMGKFNASTDPDLPATQRRATRWWRLVVARHISTVRFTMAGLTIS